MNEDILLRLRNLGIVKGARHIRPSRALLPASPQPDTTESDKALPLDVLLPGGHLLETAGGACFVVDQVYPAQYRHGQNMLGELLALEPSALATYIPDNRFVGQNFRDFVFLDTETTGLAGAGALAFMVGVAFFERQPIIASGEQSFRDVFVVRQYFLRDQDDEPAMLRQLDELLAGKAGLITFNGRSFDVPLLDNRYLMNRQRGRLPEMPHIDLLPPARRLYRARLGSCSLSALEQNLLDLRRTEEDVPGWLIPSLYYNYLRTGDARELTRVFYHNQMDMLSMVTLGVRIFRNLALSECDDSLDLVSLGRWQVDLGLHDLAESSLRAAAEREASLEVYHLALHRLAYLYKQNGRRADAVVAWQQIAFTSATDVSAHVELAKHYEWHEGDPATALEWTSRALALVERWTPTPNSRLTHSELVHRLQRLQKKVG
jgi:uncharacterized protein YprB with RNaseH-like and TPR domain